MSSTATLPAPDGVTDNAERFARLFAQQLAAGKTGVHLDAGVYLISRTIELPTALSLHLAAGARIQATPDFTGTAVIAKQRGPRGEHHYNGRITGGVIDGGGHNVIGIHVPGACRLDLCDLEILNCRAKGIFIGSDEPTWGYEVNVRSVRCALDRQMAHAPGSIGLHYQHITDSYISQVIVIGYETGVASESSSNDFSQVHVWNVPAHGPLKRCFYCNGWGDSYSQCYADSPFAGGDECYGFVINKPFNRFLNCRIYANGFTTGKVVGFHLTDAGTHGSYLNNLFTAQSGHPIQAAFAGNLEAATIIGNGYDPNVQSGRENRLPSDTGGISHIPPLRIDGNAPPQQPG